MDFQKFALGVLAIAALAAIFADSLTESVTGQPAGEMPAGAAAAADDAGDAPASLEPPRTRETDRKEKEAAGSEDDDTEGEFGDPVADGEPEEDGTSLWDSETDPAVNLDEPDLNLDAGPEATDSEVEVQLPRKREILG